MKNILITGGAGFIGSHLTERLLETGHRVTCLDNFNDYYDPAIKRDNISGILSHSNYTLIEGDILDEASLDTTFAQSDLDVIVHLAARAGVRPSLADPLLYQQVNIEGTMRLLERARKVGLKHFVFGSSSSVYGANSKVPFSESDPVEQPISPYAATKRAGELICYTYHHLHGIPISCLRFFTVYGPRQRPDMAIHKFTRQIDRGHKISLFGDGKSRRDYTYIDDIIDGLTKCINKPHGFKIYNLGESHTIELSALLRLIESALGKKADIEWLPDQPGDVPITFADIALAKEELKYKPGTLIEQGIPKFIEWYLKMKKNTAPERKNLNQS
ncbi:MAG TPA: NAD-dependent epimerase/dehydratase family protein [Actinobacteria bacterium]|nr:NAD-dependent epimerase/dehydratase family protein [Actinomycetota bacterium]